MALRLAHSVLSGAALILLFGCGTINEHSPYPQSWPQLSRQTPLTGCVDLSGTYANQPSAISAADGLEHAPSPATLAEILTRMETAAPNSLRPSQLEATGGIAPPQSITLEQTATNLVVRVHAVEGGIKEYRFRRSAYELLERRLGDIYLCDNTPIGPEIHFGVEINRIAGGAPLVGFGESNIQVSFYKTSEGSLLVRWNRHSGHLFFLVPHMRNSSTWILFSPVGPKQGDFSKEFSGHPD